MTAQTLDCDVLVIGSGPGGSTAAALLAEAGRDVLVVEEGRHYPLDSAPAYSLQEMDQKYRHGGLNTTWGRANVTYLEAICVGGASEINAALHHPPIPEVLHGWQMEQQLRDFGPDELAPYLEQVERELPVQRQPNGPGPASRRLLMGADALGWACHEVPRYWSYPPDAGPDERGRRRSMTETLVPRALSAGARLLPETWVRRLQFRGKRARWAEARRRGSPLRIRFHEVFVAAGAVQTPLLLRRSGLRRNIGDNLRIHPMIRVAARFDEEVNDPSWGVPVYQVEQWKPHVTLGCSHSSLPHVALWLGPEVEDRAEKLSHWREIAVFYALVTGTGRGSVRNLPGFDEAFVRYELTREDEALLREALYHLGELVFAAGARELYSPVPGQPPIRSRAELEALRHSLPVERAGLSTIHLLASCPMGETSRAAVDSFGRLHGFENVYLSDASIFPGAPGVNPQGTLMAIVRRNLARYLDAHS